MSARIFVLALALTHAFLKDDFWVDNTHHLGRENEVKLSGTTEKTGPM